MIVTLTDADFDATLRSSPLPVLVDFTAEWCPPCRMIEPVLRELAAELEGRIVIARLDVDAHPAAAAAQGVLGMPTLTLFVRGEPVARVVGARPKAALLRAFEEHLPVETANSAC